jgi:hypothetical protein
VGGPHTAQPSPSLTSHLHSETVINLKSTVHAFLRDSDLRSDVIKK